MIKKVQLKSEQLAEAKFLDAEHRKNMETMVRNGAVTVFVAGFVSYFDDDITEKCSNCGATVSIRPWAKKLVDKYKIRLICISCAEKEIDLHERVLQALRELISRVVKPLEG
jgi:uncharacterized spore protein YtfJ